MSALQNALIVLNTADPLEKAAAARKMRKALLDTGDIGSLSGELPHQPARPPKPELVEPSKLPRRRLGSEKGRGALLHAVSHIELNAIDLAADMIARFSGHPRIDEADRAAFISDWSLVCDDEARHFLMLAERLSEMDVAYGDYPAHNGLWEAAQSTRDNFAARVAIAPLVLEARGLDVTPGMIKRLNGVGDHRSTAILEIIYEEEIAHVATGARWFQYLAKQQSESPESYFHNLVREFFKGPLKPPFNIPARTLAGLAETYYLPLA